MTAAEQDHIVNYRNEEKKYLYTATELLETPLTTLWTASP